VRLPTFTLIIKQTVIDHFSSGFFLTNLNVQRLSSIYMHILSAINKNNTAIKFPIPEMCYYGMIFREVCRDKGNLNQLASPLVKAPYS
jgi:hypothetical protein